MRCFVGLNNFNVNENFDNSSFLHYTYTIVKALMNNDLISNTICNFPFPFYLSETLFRVSL